MTLQLKHLKKLNEMCHKELEGLHISTVTFLQDSDQLISDLENNWNSNVANTACDTYFSIIESASALTKQLVQDKWTVAVSVERERSIDLKPDSTGPPSQETKPNPLELVDNKTHMHKDETTEDDRVSSTSKTKTSSLVGVAAVLPLAYRPKDLSAYSVGTYLFGHVTYVHDIDNFTFYVNDILCVHEVQLPQLEIVEDWQKYSDMPDDGIFAIVEENLTMRANRSRTARAFLLDFGEEIDVNETHLMYCLPKTLQDAPPQAIFCQLVDGTKNIEEKKELLDLVAYKKNKFLVVTNNGKMLQLKWIAEHEISINEGRSEVSLNPFLNDRNSPPLPSSGKSQFMPELKILKGLDADDMEMLYEEPLGTTNAMKAVMGYVPKDEHRLCEFYDPKTGDCFKGSKCRFDHEPLPTDAWTKDKIPTLALSNTQIPVVRYEIGVIINIIPTYIGKLDSFYAQINSSKETFTPLIWTDEDVPDWCHLKQLPLVYDIILARYEDGLWYRASVLDTDNENKIATVFFVDYGNRQKVALRDMAKCDISISQLAHQAVVCYLDGVKELANVTKEKREFGLSFLRSMMLNQNVDVRVVEHHENLVVRFVNKNLLSSLNNLADIECVEPLTELNTIHKV